MKNVPSTAVVIPTRYSRCARRNISILDMTKSEAKVTMIASRTKYAKSFQNPTNCFPRRIFPHPSPTMTRLPTIVLDNQNISSANFGTSVAGESFNAKSPQILDHDPTVIVGLFGMLGFVVGGLILLFGKLDWRLVSFGAILVGVSFGIIIGYALRDQMGKGRLTQLARTCQNLTTRLP